jgi:hypothetical protein
MSDQGDRITTDARWARCNRPYGSAAAGDARGSLIEVDSSSWLCPNSRHPLNLSFANLHTFENAVTSSEIDRPKTGGSGGAGGAIFGGGFVAGDVDGQGGPDLVIVDRP